MLSDLIGRLGPERSLLLKGPLSLFPGYAFSNLGLAGRSRIPLVSIGGLGIARLEDFGGATGTMRFEASLVDSCDASGACVSLSLL